MGEQAVALAKAVGYQSAGTVEFIVDARPQLLLPRDEHAAAGRASGDRADHRARSRRADDPRRGRREAAVRPGGRQASTAGRSRAASTPRTRYRGFLPSIGRLVRYRPPAEVPGAVRIDTGVYEGGEISMYYDPMIAKLICHGADAATGRSRGCAMRSTRSRSAAIAHNIAFLSALMEHPRFVCGRVTTGFIAEEYPKGFSPADLVHDNPEFLHCRRRGACIAPIATRGAHRGPGSGLRAQDRQRLSW